jgi:FkbM family methyltransferase
MLKSIIQNTIIFLVRPYVVGEYIGWGRVYATLVGDYERDWLWAGSPTRTIPSTKFHNYAMHLDISHWSDRGTYFLGRWQDLDMQLFMKSIIEPGDTVVDVGASRGNFTLVASHLCGNDGKVISFEPNQRALSRLNREITLNTIKNVVVHGVGLGSRDEERGQNQYTRALTDPANGSNTVTVRKGDDLLCDERPSLIKIDVEGFECNVIAGLADTIKTHHPVIITEIFPSILSACGFSVSDLIGLMEGHGYTGYRLGLNKTKGHYTWALFPFGTANIYDAVWIHPESTKRAAIRSELPYRL